ncbi:TetR/AcrR family transcriptional regulator [Amycolatopsis eburnea]|uniref:TetR/AcrR family transcriptional regulator n=1 Tax=Amycolatopsis eburnea TaxID=2267691 RepID=A0A3R9DUW5_9PSEU|nr:TetR/AcrR family transcriptional regulator [Amycolatopsis eburnea]RSD14061.1 TetR/AcrR family transcriptional regulator [Amycolatopsis eburnea]
MAGRPRDPDLEQRLLAAAWSILTEESYAALTLTQVAVRAGAHRSDVYRRWPTKVRLVADTLDVHLPPVSEVDTGSLLSDFRAYVDDLARSWSAPWMDSLVGWLADLADDAEAEAAFRTMGLRRGGSLRSSLERALERGEIAEMPDGDLVSGLLEGPLMHARMVRRRPPTADFLDAVASAAYRVITAGAAAR